VFLPVLLWNAQHEWISFLFQIRHGLSKPEGSALRAAWRHEGDFFGGQAGLASPILFIMMAIATYQAARGKTADPSPAARDDSRLAARADGRFVLAVVAIVSFSFFVYSALRQRVEPNWPAPAYIPAIALLATMEWGIAGRKWLRAGIAFAAVMSLAIYAQGIAPILPIPPNKDPIGRAFGWKEVALLAQRAAHDAESETGKPTWLAGDRYQEASELAFQLPQHPTTFATNLSGRANQYDLWPRFQSVAAAGDNLVIVVDDSPDGEQHEAIRELVPHFESIKRGPLAELRRGNGRIGTRRVWTLVRWRGTWPVAR
jgi:undecaprenyl-diphosphatase